MIYGVRKSKIYLAPSFILIDCNEIIFQLQGEISKPCRLVSMSKSSMNMNIEAGKVVECT